MDTFSNNWQENRKIKIELFRKLAENIKGKIEDINRSIESKLYGNLYEGKFSQLGNKDA